MIFFPPFCPLERLLAVRWIIAVHLIATLLSALRRYDKTRLQKETSLLRFYANVPRRHHYENIFVSLNISPLRPNMTFVISIHSACLGTYHILLTQMQRELLRYDCSILQKNFVDSLRKEKVKSLTFSRRRPYRISFFLLRKVSHNQRRLAIVSTLTFAKRHIKWAKACGFGHSNFLMISKLWFSWVNTSTTEQEKRACSDVCWNCGREVTLKRGRHKKET